MMIYSIEKISSYGLETFMLTINGPEGMRCRQFHSLNGAIDAWAKELLKNS